MPGDISWDQKQVHQELYKKRAGQHTPRWAEKIRRGRKRPERDSMQTAGELKV